MFLNMNLKLKVKDIMSTNFIIVKPDILLDEVLKKLAAKKCNEVLITDIDSKGNEDLKGILTLTNIAKLIHEGISLNNPVHMFMTSPVFRLPPDKSIEDARKYMNEKKIGRIPVFDGNKVVGVVEKTALIEELYKSAIETKNELTEIIDELHEGVCTVDSNGIVMSWNKSAEKVYQVNAEEIIGKKLKDFFPTALLDIVLESKKPIENVLHSPRENTIVAISAKPIWKNGMLVGAVSSEIDITERSKLSMKLDEANERVKFLETEYKKVTEDYYQMGAIVGKSKMYTQAIMLAKQVSKANVNVLITGESGTGKEVFARAIHQESGRKGDFIAINCSAIPGNLLESELFGYEGGAFTGALSKGKKGKFQLADKGTLFLDEIGEMPLEMQVKLLRVLQDGVIQPIGGENAIKTDARIIAATNQNLDEMMKNGLFREDLYYRLNVVSLHLPPLRHRTEDIPLLINVFLKEFTHVHNKPLINISPEIMRILTDYEWKGNIRELKNTIERLVVLSDGKTIIKETLPASILKSNEEKNIDKRQQYDLEKVLEDTEKNIIKDVMQISKNNKKKAAEMLNIPRSTLYYKLNQYNIS